jgi:hypothetical protein
MLAYHQGCARRRADRGRGIGIREAHSFSREAIQVGRLIEPIAVTAERTVTEIIRENEDDVRAPYRIGDVFTSRTKNELRSER